MTHDDAVSLIRDAVGNGAGLWADLGAGSGTFTRALVEILGPGSTVYAVDRNAAALQTTAPNASAAILPVKADFTTSFDLPGLGDAMLGGILLANALHSVRDAERVLTTLVRRVRVGGRVVIVEYDQRPSSQWVPYPIPSTRWPALAKAAGLSGASITATRPSEYSGSLYAATATRDR
jgi:ubiquinone/menaquinone biosynthesis C-methylase UbiE